MKIPARLIWLLIPQTRRPFTRICGLLGDPRGQLAVLMTVQEAGSISQPTGAPLGDNCPADCPRGRRDSGASASVSPRLTVTVFMPWWIHPSWVAFTVLTTPEKTGNVLTLKSASGAVEMILPG